MSCYYDFCPRCQSEQKVCDGFCKCGTYITDQEAIANGEATEDREEV